MTVADPFVTEYNLSACVFPTAIVFFKMLFSLCVYMCVCVCMCVCMFERVCACMHVRVHVCVARGQLCDAVPLLLLFCGLQGLNSGSGFVQRVPYLISCLIAFSSLFYF